MNNPEYLQTTFSPVDERYIKRGLLGFGLILLVLAVVMAVASADVRAYTDNGLLTALMVFIMTAMQYSYDQRTKNPIHWNEYISQPRNRNIAILVSLVTSIATAYFLLVPQYIDDALNLFTIIGSILLSVVPGGFLYIMLMRKPEEKHAQS